MLRRAIDEPGRVRNPLAGHDDGVERGRIRKEDILRAPHHEEVRTPVRLGIGIRRKRFGGMDVDLLSEFGGDAEEHGYYLVLVRDGGSLFSRCLVPDPFDVKVCCIEFIRLFPRLLTE